MKKMLLLTVLALGGCFQTYNEEDDLRTVPVTNNPHVIPSNGGGMPMMGGGGQGPY